MVGADRLALYDGESFVAWIEAAGSGPNIRKVPLQEVKMVWLSSRAVGQRAAARLRLEDVRVERRLRAAHTGRRVRAWVG